MTTRVLHITTRWGAGKGGVKSFIDTLLCGCSQRVEQSVLSVGAIVGEPPRSGIEGPIVNSSSAVRIALSGRKLTAYLRDHRADVVHIHTNNSLGFMYAECARRAGVPMRIVHSHNSRMESVTIAKLAVNSLLAKACGASCTERWACSEEAGRHLFGKDSFIRINNAVSISRFSFSETKRREVRKELGIEAGDMVAVHVGAGHPAKDTGFALRIIEEAQAQGLKAKLILLGEGKQIDEIKMLAKELRIANSVLFLGYQDCPEKYYCAADVMLMPSVYEGLPICVIEAQANSLPVLLSDSVSEECVLTNLVKRIPKEAGVEPWLKEFTTIPDLRSDCITRSKDYIAALRDAGFTDDSLCTYVENQYLKAQV